MAAVLDTHAVIWYLLQSKNLPVTIYELVDGWAARGSPSYISAISLVELIYLVERGRVPSEAYVNLVNELSGRAASFTVVALDSAIADSLRRIPRDLVPDMPDRIIAATALHLRLPLVTRDRRLKSIGIETIW